MRTFLRHGFVLTIAILAGTATGCGSGSSSGGDDSIESQMLVNLAENYRMFSIARKQPPENFAELAAIQGVGGTELEKVRDGEIVFLWGAKLPDISEEPGLVSAPEILAYWKEVPEKGGYVLHLDRTVSEMTPAEFEAAPKASDSLAVSKKS